MCRRLRPVIFLDGVAVPCCMLPNAQLCDVCEADAACNPPEFGPQHFPSHLLPVLEPSPNQNASEVTTASSRAPAQKATSRHAITLPHAPGNPINQPAPSATFGNRFAGAQAVLKRNPLGYSDECSLRLRGVLAKSRVYCWSQALEYRNHILSDCLANKANEAHPKWAKWGNSFKLPAGCCFYCGFRLNVSQFNFLYS